MNNKPDLKSIISFLLKEDYPTAHKNDWYSDADYEKTGGKIVHMKPQEYLSKVRPLDIDDSSRDNIDDLKNHIKAGRKLDPLKIYKGGKEDGRHRAHAAHELGIKKVPVVIWEMAPHVMRDLVVKHIRSKGLQIKNRVSSKASDSEYFHVDIGDEHDEYGEKIGDKLLRVRVSDHPDRRRSSAKYPRAHVEIGPHGMHWEHGVKHILKHAGINEEATERHVPVIYRILSNYSLGQRIRHGELKKQKARKKIIKEAAESKTPNKSYGPSHYSTWEHDGGFAKDIALEYKEEGKKLYSTKTHDVYHHRNSHGYDNYTAHNKKTGHVDVHVDGSTKNGVLKVNELSSRAHNRYKAHDMYHHLISKRHLKGLESDSQTTGGKKVWQKLAKKKDISIHGWHKNKPVHVDMKDSDTTHRYEHERDTEPEEKAVRRMSLVATSTKPDHPRKKIRTVSEGFSIRNLIKAAIED